MNGGEQLLQTEELRAWYTGNEGGESYSPVLFCHRNPGVGKTCVKSQGRTTRNGRERPSSDKP